MSLEELFKMAKEREDPLAVRYDKPNALHCQHASVMPTFNEEAAKSLSALEVKKQFPRYFGACPDCGDNVILYASFMHYVMGDW